MTSARVTSSVSVHGREHRTTVLLTRLVASHQSTNDYNDGGNFIEGSRTHDSSKDKQNSESQTVAELQNYTDMIIMTV